MGKKEKLVVREGGRGAPPILDGAPGERYERV